jgi:hypothetical protein
MTAPAARASRPLEQHGAHLTRVIFRVHARVQRLADDTDGSRNQLQEATRGRLVEAVLAPAGKPALATLLQWSVA